MALCFCGLAVAVFLFSDRQARKVDFGPPNFQQQEFALVDHTGTRRTNADFKGAPIALFFGYTYCPDVCPMTLTLLGGALDEALGEAAGDAAGDGAARGDLQILFITVDPERDTPKQIADYLGLFDMPVVGLGGSEAALAMARKSFGAYARRVEQDGVVLFDHSAAVFLYDASGDFFGTIVFNEPQTSVTGKLERLLDAGGARG